MTGRASRGGCGACLAPGAATCERCGWQATNLVETGPTPDVVERLVGASWQGLWKWVWVFWTIACPLLTIGASIQNGGRRRCARRITDVATCGRWRYMLISETALRASKAFWAALLMQAWHLLSRGPAQRLPGFNECAGTTPIWSIAAKGREASSIQRRA